MKGVRFFGIVKVVIITQSKLSLGLLLVIFLFD